MARTPLTLITGPLGSGKTTLLRYILDVTPKRIAILMNEFGELAIDSRIVTGRNVDLAELGGGCVCCSLIGEFEAAVDEIIETINPEIIILETTGVAEPDALVFTIQEDLPQVWLDGVITIADADTMVRFPHLGHTTRLQIEAADIILLNKSDLVSPQDLEREKTRLAQINPAAPILCTRHCRVDPDLLFGIGQERSTTPAEHIHQPEFQAFSYTTDKPLQRDCFERLADSLEGSIYRAKGLVCLGEESYLFNWVAGRWELEPFAAKRSELVFIGKGADEQKENILTQLRECER